MSVGAGAGSFEPETARLPPAPAREADGAAGAGARADWGGPRRRRARRSVVLVLMLGAAGLAVLVLVKPFGSPRAGSGGASEGAVATSLARVERGAISSQESENGTLGYAGSYTVINQAGASAGAHGAAERGASATLTSLPAVGEVVREGEVIYAVDGEPVVLLSGAVPAYRSLRAGMSGGDVAELNADLVALGFAPGAQIDEHPEYFGVETSDALKALQERLGVREANGVKLGELALGQAVFAPTGALRITSVSGTLGGTAQPGAPIVQATSTRRQVVIQLNAAEQASIRSGDRVTITLPNDRTTPGIVSSVGKVAKSPSSGSPKGGEEEGAPTIEVQITPTDPSATGTLDQAPVRVAITTASVNGALVVPISALLALAEGGYAVEVAAGRSHHLVGVTLGLFDDADGRVQVSGPGLQAGQQVVVPST